MSLDQQMMRDAAERLHHLSMRYSGALMELVSGQPVGMIAKNYPGLREARDFIDLILFTRAEINGLTKLLLEAGIVKEEHLTRTFADEYDYFAKVKAKFLGVEVNDQGIVFRK